MKKTARLLYVLMALVAFTSCGDENRGEVVSQDVSYQLDAGYVYVNIPKEFKFDSSNILYFNGKTILNLSAKRNEEGTVIAEGKEFSFTIRLKKALDRDIMVRLRPDASLLEGYSDAGDLKEFPEGSYSVPDVRMAKGTREVTATLTFSNPDLLEETPGYLLPLRLDLADPVEGVSVSAMHYSIFVRMNLEFGKDNIDSSNDQIAGILFNNTITFESDKTGSLNKLNDGTAAGGSWYPSSASTYLIMKLPAPEKILGVKIDVKDGNYLLGKFNVYADEGNGFISYGSVDRNTKGSPIYVKFKKPVNIKALKFDGMLTVAGKQQPDLYEVNFIR